MDKYENKITKEKYKFKKKLNEFFYFKIIILFKKKIYKI